MLMAMMRTLSRMSCKRSTSYLSHSPSCPTTPVTHHYKIEIMVLENAVQRGDMRCTLKAAAAAAVEDSCVVNDRIWQFAQTYQAPASVHLYIAQCHQQATLRAYLLCALLKFSKAKVEEYSCGRPSRASQGLLRKLFKPLYRAKRSLAGMSVGVSICRKVQQIQPNQTIEGNSHLCSESV